MKLDDILYHPTLIKISYKIYEISAALGFAVMPPPPKEDYIEQLVKKNLKNIDKIRKTLEDIGYDYEKTVSINSPKDS